MDRFVVREPRGGANAPKNNTNNMIPETEYFGRYGAEYPNVQNVATAKSVYPMNPGYIGAQTMNVSPYMPSNFPPAQGQMVSGIDPRYLAGFGDNSAAFIVTGHNIPNEMPPSTMNFGRDYEHRSFVAPDRNKEAKTFTPQLPIAKPSTKQPETAKQENIVMQSGNLHNTSFHNNVLKKENSSLGFTQSLPPTSTSKNTIGFEVKDDNAVQVMSRADKLKALHETGPRVFSGPVEKVVKWHKALQEIGILIMYVIVARCVSVRPGDSCSKVLVIRDDNGPAMQVVYYEIDFLLPELKPPCTVRVIGRMMPGTCRLQAFNVRPATGDDVATLPRRAAVAAHHVSKLCKEYGPGEERR